MKINDYDLIVIKIGTNTIINNGKVNEKFLTTLINEVNELIKKQKKVIIVTSGAIGFGKQKIKCSGENIFEQQGLAAIGQIVLMKEYVKRFDSIGIDTAQILISQKDLSEKTTLENLKNTLNFLFKNNVVAIVNENDVVATEELRKNGHFSDNDCLSALLSNKINANLLIFITLSEGILNENEEIISEIKNLEEIKILNKKSSLGRGGIESKIHAIKIATKKSDVFISGANNFKGFSKEKAKGTFINKKINNMLK